MKNGIISVRLDAAYETMVNALRLPGETDSEFLKRSIDALALTDENMATLLGAGEEILSQDDADFLDAFEAAGNKRVSTLIFEAPVEEDDM